MKIFEVIAATLFLMAIVCSLIVVAILVLAGVDSLWDFTTYDEYFMLGIVASAVLALLLVVLSGMAFLAAA